MEHLNENISILIPTLLKNNCKVAFSKKQDNFLLIEVKPSFIFIISNNGFGYYCIYFKSKDNNQQFLFNSEFIDIDRLSKIDVINVNLYKSLEEYINGDEKRKERFVILYPDKRDTYLFNNNVDLINGLVELHAIEVQQQSGYILLTSKLHLFNTIKIPSPTIRTHCIKVANNYLKEKGFDIVGKCGFTLISSTLNKIF